MYDLQGLIDHLWSTGDIDVIARSRYAQFGTATRQYLGATLLPERNVNTLEFTEEEIAFRTVVANDGTRYSPAQRKQSGAVVGSFRVSLGHSDILTTFESRDYDAVVNMLGSGVSFEAARTLLGWVDTNINTALVELDEIHRWEALINALVMRRGDNGYREPVYYPNPAGHRVNALQPWSSDDIDPMLEIGGMIQRLADKGYTVNRIITSNKVLVTMARNKNVAERALATGFVIESGGTIKTFSPTRRLKRAELNAAFADEGWPSPERYDLKYNTQRESLRFFPEDAMFFACTTGRDQELVLDEEDDIRLLVPDTLGYQAIGPAAGYATPGRQFYLEPYNGKPPHVNGQGWEASLPVIQDPEALGAIRNIR